VTKKHNLIGPNLARHIESLQNQDANLRAQEDAEFTPTREAYQKHIATANDILVELASLEQEYVPKLDEISRLDPRRLLKIAGSEKTSQIFSLVDEAYAKIAGSKKTLQTAITTLQYVNPKSVQTGYADHAVDAVRWNSNPRKGFEETITKLNRLLAKVEEAPQDNTLIESALGPTGTRKLYQTKAISDFDPIP